MEIGIIGYGAFGKAIESLLIKNEYQPECVDVSDTFTGVKDVVFLAVPVQHMREALTDHIASFSEKTLFVNCSKGIERVTGALPQQIVLEVCGNAPYATVSGPSFASEIISHTPTVVEIAGVDEKSINTVIDLLQTPWFLLEDVGVIHELELAGAMKNVYAIAAGYISGSDGGKNIHAHMQVVALREYSKLVQTDSSTYSNVVRPGIVGDLVLTCASTESRNYQYGYSLAKGEKAEENTVEGAETAAAILEIASKQKVALPLAHAVLALVQQQEGAHDMLYSALGFKIGL